MDRLKSRLLLLSIAFLMVFCGGSPPAEDTSGETEDQVTLIFAGAPSGRELEVTVEALRRFMTANPDIRVYMRPTPDFYPERLKLFQDLLADGFPDIDVYQIDVVWTSAMAEHAVDLKQYVSETDLQQHFATIVDNNTVDGKLVGLPWFTDAPALFYRSDLLEKYGFEGPPTSWDELELMASRIQAGERREGNLGFWGYVWQGLAYEGLTCNALEWQASAGGGNFLDAEGKPSLRNSKAQQAFNRAANWVGRISPPAVIEWAEEESLLSWRRGDAAFMRNWSYAYADSKRSPIAQKFDVTKMPQGEGGTAAVLGGWQLMVSKYSRHPDAAARLIRFLASEEEQKRRAIEISHSPTLKSLYEDPEVLEAVPFFRDFDQTLLYAVRRPSSRAATKYGEVSEAYWSAVQRVLRGGNSAIELRQGERRIAEIMGN